MKQLDLQTLAGLVPDGASVVIPVSRSGVAMAAPRALMARGV
jgi:hypothetical protein